MSGWYRVFGRGREQPTPADLLAHLHQADAPCSGHFRGDDEGWTSADFAFADGSSLRLECYLVTEEGIRAELNNWAAWIETCEDNVHHAELMEHMVQTQQLYTLQRPGDHADEVRLKSVCVSICRFLAASTSGVYQCDGEGFFAADGTLLLREWSP